MNVRKEIETHAAPEDKEVLLWLLTNYSMSSQFHFVARCTFRRYGTASYQSHRVWEPTKEGRILYGALKDAEGQEQMIFFVWDNVKSLANYGDGKVVAMASNRDGAIEASIEAYRKTLTNNTFYTPEEVEEMVTNLQAELRVTKFFSTRKTTAVVVPGTS